LKVRTHQAIDNNLCGRVIDLSLNSCVVELELVPEMRADSSGLVHGGFVFGAADYAAMLAVNEPNVVLGSSDVRFMKPCRVGERLRFDALVDSSTGKKRVVSTQAKNSDGDVVFTGNFICIVPERHVLGHLSASA